MMVRLAFTLWLVWCLFLVVSCRGPSLTQELLDAARPAGKELVAPLARPAMVDGAPKVWALCRTIYPSSLGSAKGGLPIVQWTDRPVIGHPFVATWSARPTSPPSMSDKMPVFLLIASQRTFEPIHLAGTDGGMLMVRPDMVLQPQDDSFLRQAGGLVTLSLAFAPGTRGATVYLQGLFIERDRVAVTPMLELLVGDQ